ncbi:MAG: winged helix-turn-helix transcriptional regulator [Beijerinckiaceae bacterium]
MSPPRAEYVLTAKGRDLSPIVGAMRNWGRKYGR